jgi:hypothetical protein
LQRALLHGHRVDVSAAAVGEQVQFHVHDGRAQVVQVHAEDTVVLQAGLQTIQHRVGHGLAGGVVAGEAVHQFAVAQPVLVEQRGQFHQVPGHGQAAE